MEFARFEAAMRHFDAFAKAARPPAPKASSTSATSSAPAVRPTAPSSSAGDRLRIAAWPGLNHEGRADGAPDSVDDIKEAVRQQVQACLSKDLAPSTMSSYQAVLNSTVKAAERDLDTRLLPLDEESKFLQLFGYMRVQDQTLHWSRVRTLRAAVQKWHATNAQPCVLDAWTPQMRAFWSGLSKSCVHTGPGKQPIDFDALVHYLDSTSSTSSDVMLRNRAMIIVGFFGIRRGAEVVGFKLADVNTERPEFTELSIRCQKK